MHPKALVETEEIGANTRVWAFAHVMKGARIGAPTATSAIMPSSKPGCGWATM